MCKIYRHHSKHEHIKNVHVYMTLHYPTEAVAHVHRVHSDTIHAHDNMYSMVYALNNQPAVQWHSRVTIYRSAPRSLSGVSPRQHFLTTRAVVLRCPHSHPTVECMVYVHRMI